MRLAGRATELSPFGRLGWPRRSDDDTLWSVREAFALAVVALGACGGGQVEVHRWSEKGSDALLEARGDAAKIRALLQPPVVYGGLLFADGACTAAFPAPTELKPEKLDAFADCLARLQFRAGRRRSPLVGVSVLTYEPGIEIQARFANQNGKPLLHWIGFAGRQNVRDALPAVEADALEALRIAGDRRGTLSPDAKAVLDQRLAGKRDAMEEAWLKICVDGSGAVSGVRPIEVSSAAAAESFVAAVGDWTFRPFTFGGRPVPVCSLQHLRYPVDAPEYRGPDPRDVLPLTLPTGSSAELMVAVEALGGPPRNVDKIKPSRAVTDEVDRVGAVPLPATVQFCVDDTGKVTLATTVARSGNDPWDQQLVDLVRTWRFDPFVLQGKAVAVCSAEQFIYCHR